MNLFKILSLLTFPAGILEVPSRQKIFEYLSVLPSFSTFLYFSLSVDISKPIIRNTRPLFHPPYPPNFPAYSNTNPSWTHCWRFLAWLISAATQYTVHWTQTYYYSGFGNHKVVWHSSANDASFTTVTTGIETAPSICPERQPCFHV
jgi:hypothetical protein